MRKLLQIMDEYRMLCNMLERPDYCLKDMYERSFRPGRNDLESEISDWLDDFVIANCREMDDPEYDRYEIR